MNTLTYQGHTARIEFDDRDNTLVGRLLGIQDIVGFHADKAKGSPVCRWGRPSRCRKALAMS